MQSGAEDQIGQGGVPRLSTMLHLLTPSQDSAVLPQKLGAMYSTLAQHGLSDSAIHNYLAQQLLMRQHMERIHQLAQHEIELEQAKAKFEAERKNAQYTTVSGPPVSATTQQPATETDAEAPIGKPATDDKTDTWDAKTTRATPPAPAPDPVVTEVELTEQAGVGDSAWMVGSGVLPDGMPCEGEWLDGMADDMWLHDGANSLFDDDTRPLMSVHQLDASQTAVPQVEPVQQVDDSTPSSEVGDEPTSPDLDVFASGTIGLHCAEQPEAKRQKMYAHDAGSRRLTTSTTSLLLSSASSVGRGRSKGSRKSLCASVGVAGTPPDAWRPTLQISTAAAAAASPLSDVHAIVQAATFRMLTWQEAAVVLKHCIREHKAGNSGKLLLGPRPDVVISQTPSKQPGALYIEMPKVARTFIRLKHQKAARAAGKDAEGPTVMPDRWRNSGGGKGSSDLPKGSPKPTVRRRYGAVVPAASTVAKSSNQRKLKKENSLRYYEYTLLEHKANGDVGEHECYLFHVIRPGVPRAANS